jgi:hypothetical protein
VTLTKPQDHLDVAAPPGTEVLIPEARRRHRRRQWLIAALTASLVVVGGLAYLTAGHDGLTARNGGTSQAGSASINPSLVGSYTMKIIQPKPAQGGGCSNLDPQSGKCLRLPPTTFSLTLLSDGRFVAVSGALRGTWSETGGVVSFNGKDSFLKIRQVGSNLGSPSRPGSFQGLGAYRLPKSWGSMLWYGVRK